MWWAAIAAAADPWWSDGWAARAPLTPTAGASPDWPVVARLDGTGFGVEHAASLRFVVEGEVVPHALVADRSEAWVRIPRADGRVWAYWDNPDAAATDDDSDVFGAFDGGWWHLDGCAADACPDAAGGPSMPAPGTTAVDGVVGDSLVGGELVVPWTVPPPFTVGAWFGTDAWDTLAREGLIRGRHFVVGRCRDDEIGVFADSIPSYCGSSGLPATAGVAHHLVVSVASGALGTQFDLWVDGVRGIPAKSLAPIRPNDNPLVIHPEADGGVGRFVGVIDEVFVVPRAVDDDDVAASVAELLPAGATERRDAATSTSVTLGGGCASAPGSAAAAAIAALGCGRTRRRPGLRRR